MKTLKLGFWALFTVLFLVFAVALIGQNGEPITVTLFNYTSSSYPKWLVLLSCILVGALLATLFFIVELIVLETRNVRIRRLNQKLERALSSQAQLSANGNGPTLNGTSVTTSVSSLPTLEDDV